jgi:hypothetical protein
MIRSFSRILAFFIAFLLSVIALGQSNAQLGKRFGDNWLIGFSVGPTFFSGDLNTKRLLPAAGDWRVGGTVFAGRQMNRIFTLRGQLFVGQTAGTKDTTHFSSTLLEGNINTMINFSNLIGGENPKRFFFVYGTIGIGAMGWKAKQTNTNSGAIIPNPASNWKMGASIPIGLGGYFSIHNKVNLALEYTVRPITSDLVDGVSGGFAIDMVSMLTLGVTINLNPGTRKLPDVVDIHNDQPINLQLPNCDKTKLPRKSTDGSLGMDKLPAPPMTVSPDANYTYKVQIFAFSDHIYAPETIRQRYHIPMPVSREYSDGFYRFTVGSTKNLEEARQIKNRMIEAGIHDAFIVAYNEDGERMPFDQNYF